MCRVSGNHQGRRNGVIQVDGDSDVATCICTLGDGRAQQRTMASTSTSVLQKTVPPALMLKPDNSFAPCMSLALLEELPQSWSSERVSPLASKFIHKPFQRNICNSHSPLSHSATVSAGFHNQKLWGLFFLALEPWAGKLSLPLGTLTPPGGLHSQDIPPNF
uniref:Uncharacterized protein n=1 Tax=Rousettus aegyptiacus TaxID=9407 RepID=A0A7J8BSU2_ROUAE|nr:hypothetical protein HJG63_009575 [Rousettus aegyptiacus]